MILIAHGSIDGIGDLWNGVFHPLRCPAHLLVITGMALFSGQRARFRNPVMAFLVAAAFGLFLTQTPGLLETPPVLPAALAAVFGILVALRKPLPQAFTISLFAIGGLLLGWDSAPEAGSGWAVFKLLLGTWIGLALLSLNAVNYAAMVPKKPLLKIGFRVLGSWIVAISMLYIALSLRR